MRPGASVAGRSRAAQPRRGVGAAARCVEPRPLRTVRGLASGEPSRRAPRRFLPVPSALRLPAPRGTPVKAQWAGSLTRLACRDRTRLRQESFGLRLDGAQEQPLSRRHALQAHRQVAGADQRGCVAHDASGALLARVQRTTRCVFRPCRAARFPRSALLSTAHAPRTQAARPPALGPYASSATQRAPKARNSMRALGLRFLLLRSRRYLRRPRSCRPPRRSPCPPPHCAPGLRAIAAVGFTRERPAPFACSVALCATTDGHCSSRLTRAPFPAQRPRERGGRRPRVRPRGHQQGRPGRGAQLPLGGVLDGAGRPAAHGAARPRRSAAQQGETLLQLACAACVCALKALGYAASVTSGVLGRA